MECTATEDGLTRFFHIVIPAAQLQTQLAAKIEEVQPRVQLKGFRPGKAPASHIRKLYGPSMLQDIINEEVQKSTQQALKDADVRIASEPHLHLDSDMAQVTAGTADLAFHFHVEVMPDFEPVDPAGLTVEKPVAPVAETQVEEALVELLKGNRTYEETDAPAQDGDAVTLDFLGKIDGEPFEGGAAEGATVVIGSKQFIPGFEEQLIGGKAGEEKVLNVSFPEDYGVEHLKGKPATFEVKISQVRAGKDAVADDAFAERLGLKTIDEVRDALRRRLEAEHGAQSRAKVKRKLFDQLDAQHSFDLPPGMVAQEFNQIWSQIKADRDQGRLDEEDAAKSDEDLQAEYRKIAERRVRLGLVLAEIGRRNNVEIREEEVVAAIGAQARQFPGQERQVVEFYQKNPGARAQIRAPLYEEKVVDYILELAKVNVQDVTREELFAEDEAPAPG